MNVRAVVAALACLLLVPAAGAGIYTCVTPAGKKVFQDLPCEPGQKTQAVQVGSRPAAGPVDARQAVEDAAIRLRAYFAADPRWRQMPAMGAALQASKARVDLQVYAAALDYCPADAALVAAIGEYRDAAAPLLELADRFYRDGLDVEVDGRRLSRPAREMNEDLYQLVARRHDALRKAGSAGQPALCAESAAKLRELAAHYRGESGAR